MLCVCVRVFGSIMLLFSVMLPLSRYSCLGTCLKETHLQRATKKHIFHRLWARKLSERKTDRDTGTVTETSTGNDQNIDWDTDQDTGNNLRCQ